MPSADLVVSGSVSPNWNGDFYDDGLYNGQPSFKKQGENVFVWWSEDNNTYYISAQKGTLGFSWWIADQANYDGTYTPAGNAVGDITATIPS